MKTNKQFEFGEESEEFQKGLIPPEGLQNGEKDYFSDIVFYTTLLFAGLILICYFLNTI